MPMGERRIGDELQLGGWDELRREMITGIGRLLRGQAREVPSSAVNSRRPLPRSLAHVLPAGTAIVQKATALFQDHRLALFGQKHSC